MQVRMANPDDAAAIARIYNQGIEERGATFETEPRTPDTVRGWFNARYPIVVVVEAGEVVAFASA
ncbi:MAG TPA: N-acetyltransferase, partial [Chloroflexia bacterium]|nr:N-acetyltransferase [Chloroflexia bacterium]